MKNFTIGISRNLKRELDQVGDELKDKLLPAVSYDRVIRELFVDYRKSFPVPGKLDEKPGKPKPKSGPRPKTKVQPETEELPLASTVHP